MLFGSTTLAPVRFVLTISLHTCFRLKFCHYIRSADRNLIDKWVSKLVSAGIKIISLSDTIGSATAESINKVYTFISTKYPDIEFGLHLHTTPALWRDKVEASVKSGCKRLDGAIQGFGGCPMASDDLVGNMPTEKIISFCNENKIDSFINPFNFEVSYNYAKDIFKNYR